MPSAFALLLLAICVVGWPAPTGRGRVHVPRWAMLYAAAVVAGLVEGVLQWPAVVALAMLVALAAWTARARGSPWFWLATGGLLALSVVLVLHRVPGFHNPVAIDAVRFTADAAPFTQHLNFDKGSVGLVLLAFLAPRLRRGDAFGTMAATTVLAWLATTCVVLGLATALGVVRPDFKLPVETLPFLLVNLLLTCVAEQALFRTLVQDPLRGTRAGPWGAALLAALLFGAAHAAGGAQMVVLATLAGLGHAWVYERTRRIEAPILVHFGLNATHFLGFTYPALALS